MADPKSLVPSLLTPLAQCISNDTHRYSVFVNILFRIISKSIKTEKVVFVLLIWINLEWIRPQISNLKKFKFPMFCRKSQVSCQVWAESNAVETHEKNSSKCCGKGMCKINMQNCEFSRRMSNSDLYMSGMHEDDTQRTHNENGGKSCSELIETPTPIFILSHKLWLTISPGYFTQPERRIAM